MFEKLKIDLPFFLFEKLSARNAPFRKKAILFLLTLNKSFPIFTNTYLTKYVFFKEVFGVLGLIFGKNELISNKKLVVDFYQVHFWNMNVEEFEQFLEDAPIVMKFICSELCFSRDDHDYHQLLLQAITAFYIQGTSHSVKMKTNAQMEEVKRIYENINKEFSIKVKEREVDYKSSRNTRVVANLIMEEDSIN